MSGLTGLELRKAYKYLIDVQSSLKTVTATDEGPTTYDDPQEKLIAFDPDFEETLSKLLLMMKSKLDGPQTLSFSGMTEEDLFNLNITDGGSLKLKKDYQDRVAVTVELGKTEHWSSDGLYRHLCVLHKLVRDSRTWIDSFFFRASAMVPQGEQLVLSLEQNVPATAIKPFSLSTLGGYIDYTAIRTHVLAAEIFLAKPRLDMLNGNNHTLFVLEANTRTNSLENHVPQALGKMYACAKQLRKSIIRGAVTDGHNWIFLILKMNPDGNGAIYAQSLRRIPLMTPILPDDEEISRIMCNVIAGIIAYWIEHSDKDIGDDDWFEADWK